MEVPADICSAGIFIYYIRIANILKQKLICGKSKAVLFTYIYGIYFAFKPEIL